MFLEIIFCIFNTRLSFYLLFKFEKLEGLPEIKKKKSIIILYLLNVNVYID